ncbi:reprolysin-like metallopeptidase [Pseudomonas sp. L1(2025)]|uniref:reprolysin-like metallopeptidase n=1 Tax=Pseudomonas sp. L1(2025) TaxID=3449429 RepID=UPI003F69200A
MTLPSPSLPSAESITTMEMPLPAFILRRLNENVRHTLTDFPDFITGAFVLLNQALEPFLNEATLDEIVFLTSQAHSDNAPIPSENKLIAIIHSILFFDSAPTSYNSDCVFLSTGGPRPHLLSIDYQTVIHAVLFKLKGINYYLDLVDNFWTAPHKALPLTNKDYVANAMAVQLQCARSVRAADSSLNLESASLLLRLADLNILPAGCFYKISLTLPASESQPDIPLTGAFLITLKPENHIGDKNPCVLYMPRIKIQQFDSVAMVKNYLAIYLINPQIEKNPLFPCIAFSQRAATYRLITQGKLDEQNIRLASFSTDQLFFSDYIQGLIDQQKQNLIHMWSVVDHPPIPPEHLQNTLPRYWIDHQDFDFFGDALKNHVLTALEAHITAGVPENNQPANVPETPPTAIAENEKKPLRPIKLHIILHQDLEFNTWEFLSDLYFKQSFKIYTFASIKKDYFSWVIDEIEQSSGRTVELIEIKKESAPELYKFKYHSDTTLDSSTRWVNAVTEYLNKTSQTTSPLDKFILLTRHIPVPSVAQGFANKIGGQFAIATLRDYKVAAHEIGHMLGADHDAAEIIYNGWWNETTMSTPDEFSGFRLNAYRFSDSNREAIKTYLSQFD